MGEDKGMAVIELKNLDLEELKPYTVLNETQLKHYFEPKGGVFIAESPNAVMRAIEAGYEAISFLIERKYLETDGAAIMAKCPDVPIYSSELDVMTNLTGYNLIKGVLGLFKRKPLPSPEEIVKNARRIAVLENVTNPTNVGAIMRSAAALHMDAVLLTPSCADPLYRRSIRVGVGTMFQVPWTYIGYVPSPAVKKAMGLDAHNSENQDKAWPLLGMKELKDMGFKTAAMALKEDTLDVDDPKLMAEDKLAILLGNEGDGLSDETIGLCDYTVKIPMSHGVDSLNVAAASAVAFWALSR